MAKITRFSVTFPLDLLRDLDEVTGRMGYENRSKAVQDAVRAFVAEQRLFREKKGVQAGFLMVLYDHETRGLESTLTDLQHHFSHIICSSMHVHLNERDCLEAIAVKGDVAEIRKLGDKLAVERGVKLLKTMSVPA